MRGNPAVAQKWLDSDQEVVEEEIRKRGIEVDTEEELSDYVEYFYHKASRLSVEQTTRGENLAGVFQDVSIFKAGEDTFRATVNGNNIIGTMQEVRDKIYNTMKLEPKTDLVESQIKKEKDTQEAIRKEIESIEKRYTEDQTPEALEKLFDTTQEGENFELFQKRNTEIQGSFMPMDGKNYIKIYQTADATTLIHELSHSWLHWYSKNSKEGMVELMKWARIKNINDPEQYKTLQEKFADAFVDNYLYEGKAPNKELTDTFNNFKDWLTVVFKNVQRNEIKMDNSIVTFFDTMLKQEEKSFDSPSNVEQLNADMQELYQARKALKDRVIRAGKSHKGDVKAYVKAEIKEIQEKLVTYIESIDNMESKERGIFIRNIKNANSEKTLDRQIDIVTDKAQKFIEAKMKREINRRIDREYKPKPLTRAGGISKGKYDYETNMLVLELRGYNSLNIEGANLKLNQLLNEIGTRMPTNAEKMKLRLLNLRANGLINSSVQNMAFVLEDIKQLKEIGKTIKGMEETEKKLEKHENTVELIDKLRKNEIARNGLTRKLESIYAQGFGNIYSFLMQYSEKR